MLYSSTQYLFEARLVLSCFRVSLINQKALASLVCSAFVLISSLLFVVPVNASMNNTVASPTNGVNANTSIYVDGGNYQVNNRLSLDSAFHQSRSTNTQADAAKFKGQVKLGYDVASNANVYAIASTRFKREGVDADSHAYKWGGQISVGDKLAMRAEAASNTKSDDRLLDINYQYSKKGSMRTVYKTSMHNTNGRKDDLVLNGRMGFDSRMAAYHKSQMKKDKWQTSVSHDVGVEHRLNNKVGLTVSAKMSDTENVLTGIGQRRAVVLGNTYYAGRARLKNKFEYAYDLSNGLETEQWLTASNMSFRVSDVFLLTNELGLFNSTDRLNGATDARSLKAVLGVNYKPVIHGSFNMLGKYTYLNELPSTQAFYVTDKISQSLSLDNVYRINDDWKFTGNLKYSLASIRQSRNAGDWDDTQTASAKLGMYYQRDQRWDARAEYRWQGTLHTEEQKHDRVLMLYRSLRDDLKFGVGYSSTTLKDDLAKLDFNEGGWFVSVAGKY